MAIGQELGARKRLRPPLTMQNGVGDADEPSRRDAAALKVRGRQLHQRGSQHWVGAFALASAALDTTIVSRRAAGIASFTSPRTALSACAKAWTHQTNDLPAFI